MAVKKRRVLKKDQDSVAGYIKEEFNRRKNSHHRKLKENIWSEVDRQIKMQAPSTAHESGNPEEDWHAALQLGDLAVASEIFVADIMRLTFPVDRRSFQPHVELEMEGGELPERQDQRIADGLLRNLMVQQHKDFGFKGRVKLALKEIFHHGSVVAIAEWDTMAKYHDGTRKETLSAPTWVTHSMWHSYPDPSPYIQGTELFYRGSMIIESWMPMSKAKHIRSWINRDKLNESKKHPGHVHLLTYYGDVFFTRNDGDFWAPNRKVIVSDGIFLFTAKNELPYSPVIYTGYERDDVRDPYYTSPLVKMAPMGQFTTDMANKTMDAVDLLVGPPTQYDALDSHIARNGGPDLSPKAHNPTRGGKGIGFIQFPPEMATTGLAALQFGKNELEKGTSVDPTRAGVSPGVEQTATEVVKTEQRAEVRDVEFVAEFERGGLVPFLYMQHDLNKMKMESYPFYNDEINTPDFVRRDKSDLPQAVHFEMVGSRSLLGEEQRSARFINTVGTVAQLPPLAATTDWGEVGKQIWEDTRVKDPERFIVNEQDDDVPREQVEQLTEQAQEATAQLQAQLQQVSQQLAQAQVQIEVDKAEKARLKTDINSLEEQIKLKDEVEQAKDELENIKRQIEQGQQRTQVGAEQQTRAQVNALEQSTRNTQTAINSVVSQIEDERAAREQERQEREERNQKIIDFVEMHGSDKLKGLARKL